MPLYEYECEACAHRFELIQKFSDPPPATCPKCGVGPVQKLLSSPAIQFKGSGFYLTDYGRGTGSKSESANTKAGKADSGAASGSEGASKSGGTSDSTSSSDTKTSTSDTSSTKATPAKSD
jgi:putative FmdB family regulatory protein